jgi:hypothetical protein
MAVVVLPLNDGLEPLVVTIKPQVGTESHQQHTTMMCGMVDQNGHQQTAKSEATHCLVQELAICQCMLEPSPANILTHGAGENNTPMPCLLLGAALDTATVHFPILALPNAATFE